MHYLVDSGHLEDIRRIASVFPIEGLTTNPDILAREKTPPFDLYRRIHAEVPQLKIFHIQVTSETAEEIIREACHTVEALTHGSDALDENALSIKIPLSRSGLAAMKHLQQLGVRFTATGIFTTTQCLIAGSVGAAYAAPYITPINACGGDGLRVVREAAQLFQAQGYQTQLLGAGFSVESQVADAVLAGASCITLPIAIWDKIADVAQTEIYTKRFISLFHAEFGAEKTLLDFR